MSKYIIGIDLGTTKSVVAIYENGVPRVVPNLMGNRITPSFVARKKNKKTDTVQWLVGDAAKNQVVSNPLNTIYGVKRLIGRQYYERDSQGNIKRDAAGKPIMDENVAKMQALASYKIIEGPNGDAWVEVDGKAMAPAEISAKVLRELKLAVEKELGIEVSDAVITCPAYFNDSQIKATKDAGTIAGLNVLRVIKEPTAAALAYGMDKKRNGKIIVYDLGGGTFDVSLLEVDMDDNGGNMIKVLSTNGDTFLGGENFDERVMEHLIEVLKAETGMDLTDKKTRNDPKNVQAMQSLKVASEKVKIELSSLEVCDVNMPLIGQEADGTPINFEYTMTRGKLEELVQDLIDRTKEPCRKALADAGLTIDDVDEVLLVGAQTRMPKVVQTVRDLFGGKQPRQDASVQEIVALGASVQGAVLSGNVDNVLLLDVIPLSIGIRTAGDVMQVLIPRNTTIPFKYVTPAGEYFTTAEDNQRNVAVKVFQGERAKATDNTFLGDFVLNLAPAKQGTPQIELTIDIDANGLMQVEAKDVKTGRAQKITIKANGGLSEEDVKRMLADAEKNAEADLLFKKSLTAGTYAAQELKDAEADRPEEYFLAAPAELKEAFEATVKELTEAVAKKDIPAMLDKTAKLKEVRSAIGDAFYSAAGNGGQDGAAPTPETPVAKPDDGGPSGPSI